MPKLWSLEELRGVYYEQRGDARLTSSAASAIEGFLDCLAEQENRGRARVARARDPLVARLQPHNSVTPCGSVTYDP